MAKISYPQSPLTSNPFNYNRTQYNTFFIYTINRSDYFGPYPMHAHNCKYPQSESPPETVNTNNHQDPQQRGSLKLYPYMTNN